ncbi:cell division protein SepF [Candidatus Pacearchaeota archaeon]|nr:cell division protein SepF [Candidatus Pacearchaeota archaeon]
MVIKKLKEAFGFGKSKASPEEYIEVDLGRDLPRKAKIVIRPFVLKVFEDINPILAALREGYTIAVIDIKFLKSKDIIELKRAVAKLKKTCDALEGSISGFGENIVIAAPSFAEIYKGAAVGPVEKVEKVERY